MIPQKIRSVIGFGGLLPTGDMFAVLMFMRVFVSAQAAQRFGLLARALETAINQVSSAKTHKARILIANNRQESLNRLRQLFEQHHEIVTVDTVERAATAIQKQDFDLIICGTQFDDSRMFDLLREVKQDKQHKPRPFICFRDTRSTFGEQIESGVFTAAKIVGAACYLDGIEMSDNELLTAVEAYLPKEIWMSEMGGISSV